MYFNIFSHTKFCLCPLLNLIFLLSYFLISWSYGCVVQSFASYLFLTYFVWFGLIFSFLLYLLVYCTSFLENHSCFSWIFVLTYCVCQKHFLVFSLLPGFWNCEWEVIVQGYEGPVCEVAQVVDCHGVTVGHQEREQVEEQQEVESDGEKTLKERCACPWMGWLWKTSASGLSHVCDEWIKQCNYRLRAGVLNAACCASLRASRHSRCCPQWSHRCWRCACRCTHFSVTIYHSHLFVNFCIRRYCIYTPRRWR